jgi:decaprenyl-phosphate phosphoribosyltransferase
MSVVRSADPPRARTEASDGLLALVRPSQWVKTVLVVPLALVTTGAFGVAGLYRTGWAVVAFAVASSIIYVIDDIADRHRDRLHPVKRSRPIAAGRVPVRAAALLAVALAGALLAILVLGPAMPWWPLLAYLALNVAYVRVLKHQPLIEIGTVATGFVLRVTQGYLALGTRPPAGLLLAVFCTCLVLVLGKRRQELLVAHADHRPALRGYSVELIDHLLQFTCTLTVAATLFYLQGETSFGRYAPAAAFVSAPFALFAVSRYLQAVLVRGVGGDPVRALLHDRAIVITALLWSAVLVTISAFAHDPALARNLLP